MEKICQLIRERKSVLSFDGRIPEQMLLDELLRGDVSNPYDIPVSLKLLLSEEHGLVCPVVSGAELYIGGKVRKGPHANEAFGGGDLDMQRIDMGIALCHFELAAKAAGLQPRFSLSDPGYDADGLEYIASYIM